MLGRKQRRLAASNDVSVERRKDERCSEHQFQGGSGRLSEFPEMLPPSDSLEPAVHVTEIMEEGRSSSSALNEKTYVVRI